MDFITDKQTLDDLNLTGKYSRNSVFSLYNHTVTRGGERLLEKVFGAPLTSPAEINRRSALIGFFGGAGIAFPFVAGEFERAEDYFSNAEGGSFVASCLGNVRRRALHLIANEQDFVLHREGFAAGVVFVRRLEQFALSVEEALSRRGVAGVAGDAGGLFADELAQLKAFLGRREVRALLAAGSDLSFWEFCRFDHMLRCTLSAGVISMVKLMHKVDMYISVGLYAASRGFSYAVCKEAVATGDGIPSAPAFEISMTGVYHPAVERAVANDIVITSASNLFFLTGANMAGKSTLMKSFSIALYLAHMGFPVPCLVLEFTAMEGIFTSINVPDNLSMGYSHFYAEVMRVKMIAAQVAMGRRLVVVFDEMFKGTNVKDAFDATVCVSDAFASHRESAFVISTHIMEAAAELGQSCDGAQFWYLPTLLREGSPSYSYRLEKGVSDDRYGMTIVNNERIVEIIKNSRFYEEVYVGA
jgi:hypothetical protein